MKKRINFFVLDITITGGVERVAANFAHFFAEKEDYEFSIYSVFRKNDLPAYDLPERTNVIYLIENAFYDSSSLKKKLYSNWLMLRAFSKLSFNQNDVVISNMAGCSDYLCLNKNKNKGKLICFEHTYHGVFNKFSTFVKSNLFRKADCVVTLTQSEKEYYSHISKKVECIPNALTYDPPAESKMPRKKRIISAGRLSWEKGYSGLLDCYSDLALINKDFDFVIFGSGELKDELAKKVSGMPSNVKLFDSTPRLKEELLSSYLFVSSSLTEAFPMVMLEAMACGLPIVSYDCPCGPREIIKDEVNGRLIKVGDEQGYKDAIQDYINSPKLWKQSSDSSRELSKQFLPEVIYGQWIDLIENL